MNLCQPIPSLLTRHVLIHSRRERRRVVAPDLWRAYSAKSGQFDRWKVDSTESETKKDALRTGD